MGYLVLHDSVNDRAVFFDTTAERAIDHEAFIGADAREQADDFLDWLDLDPRDTRGMRRRGFTDGPDEHGTFYPALDHAITAWRKVAFNAEDDFVGAR